MTGHISKLIQNCLVLIFIYDIYIYIYIQYIHIGGYICNIYILYIYIYHICILVSSIPYHTYIYIYIYIYDIQFTQETCNNQIYSKYACTWGRNKHEEIKEINNSAKIKKNVLAIVF